MFYGNIAENKNISFRSRRFEMFFFSIILLLLIIHVSNKIKTNIIILFAYDIETSLLHNRNECFEKLVHAAFRRFLRSTLDVFSAEIKKKIENVFFYNRLFDFSRVLVRKH